MALLVALASPLAATPAGDREALLALQTLDLRVATIAYRLSTRNVALCKNRAPQLGVTFHALDQYGGTFRAAAKALFGLEDDPVILAVVAGSAADKAGLIAGDAVPRLNWPAPKPATRQSYAMIAELEIALNAALQSPPLILSVRRGSVVRSVTLTGTPGCASRVQVEPGRKLNAYADGIYVKLTSSVADYATDDGELASIIAHEMAHNILGHRARLDAQGRSRANIRATEIEADRLSVHLLSGAGYDPRAAARFWARFGKKTGAGIFSDGTHLRTKARVKLLEDEAALLAPAAH